MVRIGENELPSYAHGHDIQPFSQRFTQEERSGVNWSKNYALTTTTERTSLRFEEPLGPSRIRQSILLPPERRDVYNPD